MSDSTALNFSTCVPGEVIPLSPRVRRITAANPSVLTGPGTNTYLLGIQEVAVLDPGPADPAHIERIMQAVGSNLRWIVVTHTHDDHSPAAAVLARRTGAKLIGAMAPDDGYQDLSFRVKSSLCDGDRLQTPEFSLEAIHTPGHVGNHFCYLLKEEGMLFTGDHIMEGSTVVIIPPSGDMADYMDSLRRINRESLVSLAPGHGKLIAEPGNYIDYLIQHRLKRESKVKDGLARTGTTTLKALVPVVYDDVSATLHDIAAISLWAHLIKLEKEGLAQCDHALGVAFDQQHWHRLP